MDPKCKEITTKQGRLKGLVKKSDGNAKITYYSFQGIPYAKPPVGDLRFQPPEPYGKWEGVREAAKEGNDCPQLHMLFQQPIGDEDCLYLNVYSPQRGFTDKKKAVMVWIHGGGFEGGSGSSELYGPDYLVEQDIVLVTINYRCGALGFLSLETEELPGNNGLKDQALALKWVQENISSFGGDPGNVTIFGESAGGASVNYHLLSPLSRGLFHKAILQSGFSVCSWAYQRRPREVALKLAKELGCNSKDPNDVLEFLKSVCATNILKAQSIKSFSSSKERIHTFGLQFLPCVEKGKHPFLPDSPSKMMERGEFAKVPLIFGVVDKEGLLALVLKEVDVDSINKDLSVMVPLNLDIKSGANEQQLGKDILRFYTNHDTLSWNVMNGYIDYATDIGFAIAMERARQCFLANNSSPVYAYQFTYYCQRALSTSLLPMAYPDKGSEYVGIGASHGDEMIHQFKSNLPQVPYDPPTAEDQAFMNKFLKAWANFAKTGDPNSAELEVTWSPDSIQEPNYLEIGKVWKAVSGISFPKRMEFWKNLYQKYDYAH